MSAERGRRGRERDTSPKLTVIYWQDIPSQVMAQKGRERISIELSPRFLKAIDSAAMFAGKTEAKAYMEHWRKVSRECGEDLEAEVQAEVQALEEAFSREDLRQLIKSKGVNSNQQIVKEE